MIFSRDHVKYAPYKYEAANTDDSTLCEENPSQSRAAICYLSIANTWTIVNIAIFACSLILAAFAFSAHYSRCMMHESHQVYCMAGDKEERDESANVPIAPAQEALTYQALRFQGELRATNDFKGKPSPRLDKAWSHLVNGKFFLFDSLTYIKLMPSAPRFTVSKAELQKADIESIELADHSGRYLVQLDVFHELHCLNFVRQRLHRDYYNETMHKSSVDDIGHAGKITSTICGELKLMIRDHCIDMIRQSLQCHADISLVPFQWKPTMQAPWPNFSTMHQCRNFEKIQEWGLAHGEKLAGRLIHPLLGPVPPELLT